jgi:hypothetical protein
VQCNPQDDALDTAAGNADEVAGAKSPAARDPENYATVMPRKSIGEGFAAILPEQPVQGYSPTANGERAMTFGNKSVTCALLVGAIALGPNLARSAPQRSPIDDATEPTGSLDALDAALTDEHLDRFIDAAVAVDELCRAYATGNMPAWANDPAELAAEVTAVVEDTLEAHGLNISAYRSIGERLEVDASPFVAGPDHTHGLTTGAAASHRSAQTEQDPEPGTDAM